MMNETVPVTRRLASYIGSADAPDEFD